MQAAGGSLAAPGYHRPTTAAPTCCSSRAASPLTTTPASNVSPHESGLCALTPLAPASSRSPASRSRQRIGCTPVPWRLAPVFPARGQVTHLPPQPVRRHTASSAGLATSPPRSTAVAMLAPPSMKDADPAVRDADHAENLPSSLSCCPVFRRVSRRAACRAALESRPVSPDRLPIVGAVPKVGSGNAPARTLAGQRFWCARHCLVGTWWRTVGHHRRDAEHPFSGNLC